MRDLDPAVAAALALNLVVVRDLIWVTAKNRDTEADETLGFWSGQGTPTIAVVDGITGLSVSRAFRGLGGALVIGDMPLTSDLTVRNMTITLPQTDDIVQLLVRGYDVRNAPIQRYRAFFDKNTRALLADAKADFIGQIDEAPIITPKKNTAGSITLKCVSTTRELTRTSSEVRSHESQLLRSATDTFYKDTASVSDWEIPWGVERRSPVKTGSDGSNRTAGLSS